ncbi:MAG: NAD(P)-dependent oxidoreductase, partial [Spirochaetes bacterium]
CVTRKRAAVIGTGIMGTGMGKTLLRKSWEITCWNRTPENTEELVNAGAILSTTPAEATSEAEYILSIL